MPSPKPIMVQITAIMLRVKCAKNQACPNHFMKRAMKLAITTKKPQAKAIKTP